MFKFAFLKLVPIVVLCTLLQTSCTKSVTPLTATRLNDKAIPKTIKYKGDLDTAVTYTDNGGVHLVITSEDRSQDNNGDEEYRRADVYAYCYKMKGDKWQFAWQLHDFADECQEDVEGSYLPNSFAVTDLNSDSKAEVWLMYKTACRGDVSPSDMKVIMREGDKKYAMRGSNRVKINGIDYTGGDYKFDSAFKNGPEVFRQYAEALWKKNIMEVF